MVWYRKKSYRPWWAVVADLRRVLVGGKEGCCEVRNTKYEVTWSIKKAKDDQDGGQLLA